MSNFYDHLIYPSCKDFKPLKGNIVYIRGKERIITKVGRKYFYTDGAEENIAKGYKVVSEKMWTSSSFTQYMVYTSKEYYLWFEDVTKAQKYLQYNVNYSRQDGDKIIEAAKLLGFKAPSETGQPIE